MFPWKVYLGGNASPCDNTMEMMKHFDGSFEKARIRLSQTDQKGLDMAHTLGLVLNWLATCVLGYTGLTYFL